MRFMLKVSPERLIELLGLITLTKKFLTIDFVKFSFLPALTVFHVHAQLINLGLLGEKSRNDRPGKVSTREIDEFHVALEAFIENVQVSLNRDGTPDMLYACEMSKHFIQEQRAFLFVFSNAVDRVPGEIRVFRGGVFEPKIAALLKHLAKFRVFFDVTRLAGKWLLDKRNGRTNRRGKAGASRTGQRKNEETLVHR